MGNDNKKLIACYPLELSLSISNRIIIPLDQRGLNRSILKCNRPWIVSLPLDQNEYGIVFYWRDEHPHKLVISFKYDLSLQPLITMITRLDTAIKVAPLLSHIDLNTTEKMQHKCVSPTVSSYCQRRARNQLNELSLSMMCTGKGWVFQHIDSNARSKYIEILLKDTEIKANQGIRPAKKA